MVNAYSKFYIVDEIRFENSDNKLNAKANAIKYCRKNHIDESHIFELSSESEYDYLHFLLENQVNGHISNVCSHRKVQLLDTFVNAKGQTIPPFTFEVSFSYIEKGVQHDVCIINGLFDITKDFILCKTLYDNLHKDTYLEVYYQVDDGLFLEWAIGNKQVYVDFHSKEHKDFIAKRQMIRDKQKIDKLMKLRSDGLITESQKQELYRLEQKYGGV